MERRFLEREAEAPFGCGQRQFRLPPGAKSLVEVVWEAGMEGVAASAGTVAMGGSGSKAAR